MKVAAATGDMASPSYDKVALMTIAGLPSSPVQLIKGSEDTKRL